MEEKVIVTKRKLTAIGDNIRSQTKTTKQYTLDEMASMKLGGSDTSDATATSEDILFGKTAYVNDVKVVGTIEEYDGSYEGGIDTSQEDGLVSRTLTTYSNSSVTSIGNYAFYKMSALTSVNLQNVTSVGAYAFRDCTVLTNAFLPKVTSIGNYAFNSCYKLTSIVLPKVTSIGNYAFQYCYELKSAVLPLVTSVGNIFQYCWYLTSVDLSNVTEINNVAFLNCYSLKIVVIRQESQVCTLTNTNAFSECFHLTGTVDETYNPNGDKDGYIYVPDSLVDSYKSATNWSTYADQIKPLSEYVEV